MVHFRAQSLASSKITHWLLELIQSYCLKYPLHAPDSQIVSPSLIPWDSTLFFPTAYLTCPLGHLRVVSNLSSTKAKLWFLTPILSLVPISEKGTFIHLELSPQSLALSCIFSHVPHQASSTTRLLCLQNRLHAWPLFPDLPLLLGSKPQQLFPPLHKSILSSPARIILNHTKMIHGLTVLRQFQITCRKKNPKVIRSAWWGSISLPWFPAPNLLLWLIHPHWPPCFFSDTVNFFLPQAFVFGIPLPGSLSCVFIYCSVKILLKCMLSESLFDLLP